MATTLLLIDLQRNMLEPPGQVPAAARLIETVGGLLERARAAGASVIHIRNNGTEDESDFPGVPGWELYHAPIEGEAIVDKFEHDAFEGTNLSELIPQGTVILVAGLVSEYCVRSTLLTGLCQGYDMRLVRGAHATYDREDMAAETIEKGVEEELRRAGVTLVDLRGLLFVE